MTNDIHSLQGSILSLHASNVIAHGPPVLHFEPQQLLNFDFDAGPVPDPAFDFDADPDTAFHSETVSDPCTASGSGSATLLGTKCFFPI